MTHPTGLDVVELVSTALRAGRQVSGAYVIPTVLLDRELLEEREPLRGAGLANAAVAWFESTGLYAERSHVGGHGYGEIIKEIMEWYPQDIESLRAEQQGKLAVQTDLLARGCHTTPEHLEAIRSFSDWQFKRTLALMRSMTESECHACYYSIFEEYVDDEGTIVEDYRERAGSPDLLVWHRDESLKLWFFCEVKSLNDHLGPAQVAWIKESWDQIRGRFLLLLLDS